MESSNRCPTCRESITGFTVGEFDDEFRGVDRRAERLREEKEREIRREKRRQQLYEQAEAERIRKQQQEDAVKEAEQILRQLQEEADREYCISITINDAISTPPAAVTSTPVTRTSTLPITAATTATTNNTTISASVEDRREAVSLCVFTSNALFLLCYDFVAISVCVALGLGLLCGKEVKKNQKLASGFLAGIGVLVSFIIYPVIPFVTGILVSVAVPLAVCLRIALVEGFDKVPMGLAIIYFVIVAIGFIWPWTRALMFFLIGIELMFKKRQTRDEVAL
jgi:hypothetical protein